MGRRYRVVVVQGGASEEAEVSRASARAVVAALRSGGHTVALMELDPFLPESIRSGGFDVVFPVAHGGLGENGALQGLLDVIEVAYVGSTVRASAIAMDKPTAKLWFRAAGVPVAEDWLVHPGDEAAKGGSLALLGAAWERLDGPFVSKPAAGGSAIGVTPVRSKADFTAAAHAVEEVLAREEGLLFEAFVAGDEVTCGVLDLAVVGDDRVLSLTATKRATLVDGSDGAGAFGLPPIRIRSPKDVFYTFEARYAPGRSVHECPPPYPDAWIRSIQEAASRAHRALGCRDYSRVDFVVNPETGSFVVLEVNTLPGFTSTSLFPEAAAAGGYPLGDVCQRLVDAAVRRGPARKAVGRPLPP